jgi:hypothetical protein
MAISKINLILQVLLQIWARVKVGTADHDEAIEHITIKAALLFFMILAVMQAVLVLDSFNSVTELDLVLADNVYRSLEVVELGRGVSVSSSGNGSRKIYLSVNIIA